MNAIRKVFPTGDEDTRKRRMYVLCIKALMVDIAVKMKEFFPDDQVLLVHESGNWNAEALQAYELMVAEEKGWDKGTVFCGFSSLTAKQSIGFEACDLFAYEVFKGIKAKTDNPGAGFRGAAQEMMNRKIAMSARWINLNAAQALHRVMEESGKYPDLDTNGLT